MMGAHQRAVTKDSIHGTELSLNFKELYQPKVDCDNSDAQRAECNRDQCSRDQYQFRYV